METYVDLEAQVLKDGMPFTRPTRWAHGLASFGDKPEPAHWKLYPGASNVEALDVVAYVQFMGWMSENWALIRSQISVDGIMWPQTLPGQMWVPPVTGDTHRGWTCALHFDALSNMDRLRGVHSLLLRAIREERDAS